MSEESHKNKAERPQKKIIAGIQFSSYGKVYHFDATKLPNLELRDKVIVQTSRGWQLGNVIQLLDELPDQNRIRLKPITRMATPRDLLLYQSWKAKENEVQEACKQLLKEKNIKGVKIVKTEYSYDGSALTILVNSSTDEKINLKRLRSDLQSHFRQTSVYINQVGPRDVAKIIEGIGACGIEKRCCSRFLTEFSSISIKMAKKQSISLTPSEITGICGRLRCCLLYEHDQYIQAMKNMPKKRKRVKTPQGEGRVVSVLALKGTVYVDIPDVGRREFPREDIEIITNPPPTPRHRKRS
jgi:cell fate regulator YaaT (PSP1 superfamily)